jgi:hypothetical protein
MFEGLFLKIWIIAGKPWEGIQPYLIAGNINSGGK